MRWPNPCALGLALLLASSATADELGRPAKQDEIELWNIDVRPDGEGLPTGSGSVAHGRDVYRETCLACHGSDGQGGIKDRLVGGEGTLASDKPIKTIGSFWPYATTLFDYVRRSMPYPAPGLLSANDTYAVVAYILHLNGLLPADGTLDRETLPQIRMPNRDGFIPDPVFQIDDERGVTSESKP